MARPSKPRTKKRAQAKTLKPSSKIKETNAKDISIFPIYWQSLVFLKSNLRIFIKYSFLALLLAFTTVQGIGSLDELTEGGLIGGEDSTSVLDTLANEAFAVLEVSQSSNASGVFYRFVIFTVLSMSLLWIIRSIYDGKKVTLRGAFYGGTAQFVPFSLVLLMVFIMSWPGLLASSLTSSALSSGLLVTNTEKVAFYVVMASLYFLSFVLMSGSLFGLIISTLSGSTPIRSLKSGFEITQYDRVKLLRQLLGALIITAGLWLGLIVASLQITPALGQTMYYLLSMLAFLISHIYVYILYREYIKR